MRLALEPDGRVVDRAEDGKAAIILAVSLAPDVILMDPEMPRVDGVTATTILRMTALDLARGSGTSGCGRPGGSTETLSNPSMNGVDMFQAIINPPHSIILAAGRITERPVVRHGATVAAPTFWLAALFDHRIATARRRVPAHVADYVDEPPGLLQGALAPAEGGC